MEREGRIRSGLGEERKELKYIADRGFLKGMRITLLLWHQYNPELVFLKIHLNLI